MTNLISAQYISIHITRRLINLLVFASCELDRGKTATPPFFTRPEEMPGPTVSIDGLTMQTLKCFSSLTFVPLNGSCPIKVTNDRVGTKAVKKP